MAEEHKKIKGWVQDTQVWREDIIYKNGSCLLFQNVSMCVHWHAEEGKSDAVLSLNLATVITGAAYKLHSWAETNL